MNHMTGTAGPTETELKFAIASADLAAFKTLPFLAEAPVTRTTLAATYFDTSDHALHGAGFSLRLRRENDRTIQTLKGASTGGAGLFARPETERPVAADTLDESMLAEALPVGLALAAAGHLTPVFTVRVERTHWLVRRGSAAVGVSLDQGWIEAGDRREPITEVEFEMHEGAIDAAFDLARQAARQLALHLEPLAKSARGYRLLGADPAHVRPAGPDLTAEIATGAAIRQLMAGLLEAVAIAREQVLSLGDVEAVHQLRVLLRRLRSLIEITRETLDPPKLGHWSRAARRAFRRLGRVRDLDILTAAIPCNDVAAEAALVRVAAERQAALERAQRLLVSRRFAATLLGMLAFAASARTQRPDSGDSAAPMAESARALLAKRWRRVKAAKLPASLAPAARHQLRIKAKTMRYAADFFEELYPNDRALKRRGKFGSAIRHLQDKLGALNDRDSMERLARHHLGRRAATALGLDGIGAPSAESLATADEAYAKLLRCKPFWR